MLDLPRLAELHGARPALEWPEGALSHAALAARVDGAWRALRAAGLAPGERVAWAVSFDLPAILDLLACAEHGCGVLALDGGSSAAELARYGEAFGAAWRGRAGRGLERVAPDGRPPAPPPDGPAGALHALPSSGSSGAPKLALVDAKRHAARVESFVATFGLSCEDRVLCAVSLGHGYGLTNGLFATLASGACLVLPRSRHPRAIAAQIVEQGVTRFSAPPSWVDLLLRALPPGACPHALRSAHSVGDALSRDVFDRFGERFGLPLWQSYGTAETGAALLNRTGAGDGATLALGRPYEGVEVTLRDAEGRRVAEGEVGEIVVHGPGVALGYAAPGRAGGFREGGFFTGDLGVSRAGEIHFAGRRKLVVPVAGRKVSPEEVEQVLRGHPAVADAAVFGQPDGSVEGVAAWVVLREPVSALELMAHCGASLASYKVPRRIEFRDALPRGAAGKLLRGRLG